MTKVIFSVSMVILYALRLILLSSFRRMRVSSLCLFSHARDEAYPLVSAVRPLNEVCALRRRISPHIHPIRKAHIHRIHGHSPLSPCPKNMSRSISDCRLHPHSIVSVIYKCLLTF